ncbi:hypothetical protein IGI04_025037 [Brassica rapa subsp. trilocularis]|uniref:Uncharacterized protein n=1 Tax=Brassica rapa subsp. trilocularis TaxID=1813537 RepID=A0ABQ7M8E6_BRACM|nr:hypothetical protein IGI04_025037 [Brassica rapa subsp. trilocularis]
MDVKVETRTLEEVKEVFRNGDVDVTMLNDAVELINGRAETEKCQRSGALTHSVNALDISLKIDTELALEAGRRTKRA